MHTATFFAYLCLAAGFARAVPIELAGEGLDEETWSIVGKGTWLVEHYSPYCSHCRAFAPKWKQLNEMFSETAPHQDFHFAQVDCAANGDLCHKHDVKYYPSIFLYRDGEFEEEYTEKRSVEELAKYVEANWQQPDDSSNPYQVVNQDVGYTVEHSQLVRDTPESDLPTLSEEEEAGIDGDAESPDHLDENPAQALTDNSSLANADIAAYTLSGTRDRGLGASTDTLQTTSTGLSNPKFLVSNISNIPGERPESKRSAEAEEMSITLEWEKLRGQADGTVKLLSKNDADRIKDQEAGPSFVKFFAPWCGHCKKLAPHWEALASSLKSQVHIYQVDCDLAENKSLCKRESVQAYPTLIFYNRGAVVEYHGRREEKSMKEWALKTIDATTIKPLSTLDALSVAVQQDPVVVLLLFSEESDRDDVALAREVAKSQMGPNTPFYTSTSSELFTAFKLSAKRAPTFLVFKSGSLQPTATYMLPVKPLTKRQRAERTRNWLRGAKLPVVSELDGSSYSDLFPEDTDRLSPYVVLGFFSKKGLKGEFERTLSKFKSLAEDWSKQDEREGTRAVAWAWVDGDRWAPWSRGSYDVKMGAIEGPVLLVADPHERVYWKNDMTGSPLTLNDSKAFALIQDGIRTGKVPGVSSDGFVRRWSKSLVKSVSSVFGLAMDHPFLAFFVVVSSWVGVALCLQQIFSPSHAASAGGNSFKTAGFVKKD